MYDTDDVIQMMARGARNRHMAETKMNERSSRSHQVLTIIVGGVNKVTGARSHACLHLVDLAGSERTSKSGAEGEPQKSVSWHALRRNKHPMVAVCLCCLLCDVAFAGAV